MRYYLAAAFTILFTIQALGEEVTVPALTVNANKYEEDLQKLPQAVSVFNEDRIQDLRVNKIDGLGMRVPNLTFSTGGMTMINFASMRGVRSDPHNNISSMVMYVDNIPVSTSLGFNTSLFDIRSVEVLRGPQGTLYGMNSEGGVIKVTSFKPGNETKFKMNVDNGTRNMLKAGAMLSGALVKDLLYASGSFKYYQKDGLVTNLYDGTKADDKKDYSGRIAFRLTPADRLEINLSSSFQKYDEGSFSMYNLSGGSGKRKVNTPDPGYNTSAFNDQALSIVYKISPEWELFLLSTRRESDVDYAVDYDFSPAKGMEVHRDDHHNGAGQEIRVNYNGSFDAVAGLNYDYMKKDVRYSYPNMNMKHLAEDKTQSYSAFGQLKLPFAGSWAFTAGVRGDYYTTDYKNHNAKYSKNKKWTDFSPKAALEYSITDDHNVYISFAKSYRAAGFNSLIDIRDKLSIGKEELYAFEMGSKNIMFEGKMRFNASLFYYKYNNLQVEAYFSSPQGPMPYYANIGDPYAAGGEVELDFYPLNGLNIFASSGYTYMRYGEFSDSKGSHKGNRIPFVPDFTYNAGIQYRDIDSGMYFMAELKGVSKTYLDSVNKGHIPAYNVTNIKAGIEYDTLEAYLFADNIFDKRHDYVNGFGGNFGVAEGERTVGVSMNVWY